MDSGGGFVRATLKNMLNPNSFEKTFTSDELGIQQSSCVWYSLACFNALLFVIDHSGTCGFGEKSLSV